MSVRCPRSLGQASQQVLKLAVTCVHPELDEAEHGTYLLAPTHKPRIRPSAPRPGKPRHAQRDYGQRNNGKDVEYGFSSPRQRDAGVGAIPENQVHADAGPDHSQAARPYVHPQKRAEANQHAEEMRQHDQEQDGRKKGYAGDAAK